MNLSQDFKEFIELLNGQEVKYLIIGGYAVGFHSRPKFTNDIDIWIENSLINAKKVLRVLEDFGFSSLDIQIEDLIDPDKVIQLGYAPVRIDIITGLSGLDFAKAYDEKIAGNYLGVNTYFISKKHLIKSKKKAGRKKDIDDIDWINRYLTRNDP